MRILKADAQNFGSYKRLSFDYSNLGLGLVSGLTGSGKSTLVDLPCWVLYGITSKDGAADDVLSFGSDETTIGSVVVHLGMEDKANLVITRIRGKGKNDLYWQWWTGWAEFERGRDLIDSQKQLESILGVTSEQYIQSTYLHQFSKMDSFFFAKAKERRELLEEICDLSFVQNLSFQGNVAKGYWKDQVHQSSMKLAKVEAQSNSFVSQHDKVLLESKRFDSKKYKDLEFLKEKLALYEDKITMEDLQREEAAILKKIYNAGMELNNIQNQLASNGECPLCGNFFNMNVGELTHAHKETAKKILELDKQKEENSMQVDKCREMHHLKNEIDKLNRENPYKSLISDLEKQMKTLEAEMRDVLADVKKAEDKLFLLDKIQSLTNDLRTQLLQSTVKGLEKDTNKVLEAHFDSAIRVKFILEDSDKVQVEITNDGHKCSYKQLSGGQRRMLTLAFSVSVMERTANKTGFHPNLLVFDESLNGLDSELKVKAFTLFQSLVKTHESVLLMDHSEEMKELFDTKIVVTKEGSESHVSIES